MPSDGSWERTARHVRQQAAACAELGSPLYGGLLERVAQDLLDGGPTAAVLSGHEHDPRDSALALRLMGGVHRLVLEREAPGLAVFYPSVGGTSDVESAWPALRAVLEQHRDRLRRGLDQPPQTNEVGRGAALIGGLRHVAAVLPGPLRLFELGASAGLNLRADHFRVDGGDGSFVGPTASPVVLRDAWAGEPPPRQAVVVVERGGCDVAPLDPTTTEGRLRLTCYVWPDQLERLERLRGALELAVRVPAEVVHQGAAAFLRGVELAAGTTAVLWHSVMWQYLPSGEQEAVTARIAELGEQATPGKGFAHLRMEPETRGGDHAFYVILRLWPGDGGLDGGADRVLGIAHPHGLPTTWR